MAFVSCREIAVHYTGLRRQLRLWYGSGLHECHTLCALYVAYGLQAATWEWFDTRNETIYLLQDHCSSLTARIYTLVNKCTNSFVQISLVLSIRGRICDFLPWALSVRPCTHSIEKNQPQCTVRDGLAYKVKSKLFLCEVVIVLQKYWKRNWTNDCCF